MAKQLNVNLAFTADTSKAKQQIQDLQNQLTKFLNQPMSGFGDALTKDIKEASRAAAELKVHLEKATNPNTGTLDFSKLNQSMKQANTSISQYAAKIRDMGPEGQKSFMMLAQSVAAAEVPIRRSNALLDEMWTTMKNTMRWQISSSILHGFMGAISSATGYAKDLNESLNNIRIVTGQSVDQMAKFAENANKAAKALSTTTTEYTNAALIYYQQGLSDKDVLARTDITVKMANVASESAQKVSDQLTAVWNNFYDGSKSLEYYADVMTALGAATASSTDEISEGLNKFAAVAETVGLSYEYAASALATVTATTRQSADIVGTAFKTLFARVQDLELGKTLDDGTSLGKYSAALAAVGVNIKDSNGGLKEMDQILEEMASKWDTLNKDQQVSLAQTVAGVRQYTQLIALMDNWDFMQENLATSYGSTGALQEQADIYEESWQAASDRVRAALEDIYSTLIDDEFFIDLLDSVEKIIKGFDYLIDRVGGLKGVVSILGVVLTNVFSKQLTETLQNIGYNLQNLTEEGRKKVQDAKKAEMQRLIDLTYDSGAMEDTQVEKTMKKVLESQMTDQISIMDNAKNLTEIEMATLRVLQDQKKARGDLAIQAAREYESAKQGVSKAAFAAYAVGADKEDLADIRAVVEQLVDFELANPNSEDWGEDLASTYNNLSSNLNEVTGGIKEYDDYIAAVRKAILAEKEFKTQRKSAVDDSSVEDLLNTKGLTAAIKARIEAQQLDIKAKEAEKRASELATATTKNDTAAINDNTKATKLEQQAKEALAEAERLRQQATEAQIKAEKLETDSKRFHISAEGFVEISSAIMGTVSTISMLGSAWESISDPDTSAWEKLTNIMMSLGMTLPTMANSLKKLSALQITSAGATLGQAAAATKLGGAGVKAFTAFGGSATGAAAGVAALIPYIAIAAAAITAVVLIVKKLVKIRNADAIAAEKSAKSAEELKKVVDDTKQAYDNLKSNIENYQNAEKAIVKLKENTLEWKQAILEANSQVLDLLEKYPELINYVSQSKGQLKISDEGLNWLLESQFNELNQTQMASYSANIQANEKANASDITKLSRQITYKDQVRMSKDPDDVQDYQRQVQSHTLEAAIEAIQKNGEVILGNYDDFTKALNAEGITNESLIAALWENSGSLRDLSQTINSRNLANDTYRQQVTASYLQVNNSRYGSYTQKQQDALSAAVANQISEDKVNDFISTGKLTLNKDVASDYSSQRGWDVQETSTKDGVTTFTLTDGSKIKIDYSTMQKTLAENQILSQFDTFNYESLLKGKYGAELLSFGVDQNNYNVNQLTQDQVNGIKSYLEQNSISNETAKQLGFENAKVYSDSFSAVLNTWDEDLHIELMKEQEAAEIRSMLESAAAQYDLNAEELLLQSKNIQKEYDISTQAAAKLAVQNQRMNQGISELSESWEEWEDILKSDDKTTADYAKTAISLTKTIAKLVGASDDLELPQEFLESDENLKLIEKAAQGDIKAINELGVAVGKAAVDLMKLEYSSLTIEDGTKEGYSIEIDSESFETSKQKVLAGITELQDKVASGALSVGDAVNSMDADWVNSLNQMALATGMSVEEMNNLLNELGVETEVTTIPVKQKISVPQYRTYTDVIKVGNILTGDGRVVDTYTVPQENLEVEGVVNVAQIGAGDNAGKPPKVNYIGNGNVSKSAVKKSSGGGSSKPKTAKSVNKSDTVDRYKEVNDLIEDLQHNLDISNKKADALWGEARFKEMRKGVKILEEENKLLEEKANLANAYLAEDAAALKKAAGAAGINFTFNADGNISNYTTEMTRLWTQLDNAITSANKDGDVSDSEQERIDKLQEKVDAVKDAISQYEDTLKTKQDIDKEYLDNQQEIWDTNFDILTESLEYNLSFNEADLELIDYYLSKMEDNMFKLAEAYTKLNEKSIEYSDNLDIQRKHYEDLTESFKNGKISEAQYKEALLESQSAIVDTLQSLLDLDKEMQEYYGNTLDKAAEEIDIYADKMDHLNSVLDHYNNIMDLTGKSKDYEAMATILEGQAENLHNQLQIAKEEYDMYKTQAEYWEQMMATVDETDPAFETYKKNWDAAETATNDAQDEMLSKTQEWAEAMKAVIENELADIGQTLEKSITGGTSFDELLTSMERANSLQEEYLTDTNKIYETNKLIRTAQQEIDKTTNTVAKNKLKQFINETNQLQEQTKLSEYELKIQQAKYDLVIAEIALEEAQQAKSMVRLTRDSDGNFGYVYTADQNQIDAAQQKLEDAQNSLYNIGLEGANDYSQKYAETMQEMYDTLQEIQTAFLNGEIATQEEYDRRMLEAKEYYFDKLKDFSSLYQVALTTDSRVVNDAWSSDFNDMIYKTEELKSAVNDYADQSAGILKEWADTVKETIDGSGLDDVNKAVSGIVSDSEKLTEVLSGEDGLISKLNEEINKVKESTSKYALKRAEIQGLISDYENLAKAINADYDDKNITAPETTFPSENAASAPESATGPASNAPLGVGSAVKVKAGATWYSNSYGGGSSGRARNGTILYVNESGTHPYNIDGLGWVRKEDLESFKSGGYTGAWGSYGKLALLDEKELILNAGDTANFLASMEVLERILSIIDLHSANAQLSGVLSAPGFNHMNERSIEQNVHIEASFPGVQDRNEIEEAFNNLINQASQYANRK